ncbi:CAP domain-containing protein [Mucilaginibacter sp.]|uniref:CAP domain-containing protein n=1 Tax=Mucilaginibacter sp. TaxID=1882438 RepID=UPI002849EDEB|nr:CAP domain-containing protein [Mucilaginibacter sp.]MDR3694000.1 CAP domain-containing protein [Mucilaginibacter sp.]
MKWIVNIIIILIITFILSRAYGQETVSTPQFRRTFLKEINRVRQTGCNCGVTYMPPVPQLIWNDQLEISSMGHAADMASHNYFSHTSLDGRTMQDRILAAGYSYKGFKSFAIGENIAEGPESIAEVMKGWFHSPGHCKNLMSPQFKEVGVAYNNTYWVQDFGGREAFSPYVQKMIRSGKYQLVEKQ